MLNETQIKEIVEAEGFYELQSQLNRAMHTMSAVRSFYVTIAKDAFAQQNLKRLNMVLSEPLAHSGATIAIVDGRPLIVTKTDDHGNTVERADNWYTTDVSIHCDSGFHIEIAEDDEHWYVIVPDVQCSLYCGDSAVLISRFMGQGFHVKAFPITFYVIDTWCETCEPGRITTGTPVTMSELFRILLFKVHLDIRTIRNMFHWHPGAPFRITNEADIFSIAMGNYDDVLQDKKNVWTVKCSND